MTKYQRFVTRLLRDITNTKSCRALRIVLEDVVADAYAEAGICLITKNPSAANFQALAKKCNFMVGHVAMNLYSGRIFILSEISTFVRCQ